MGIAQREAGARRVIVTQVASGRDVGRAAPASARDRTPERFPTDFRALWFASPIEWAAAPGPNSGPRKT